MATARGTQLAQGMREKVETLKKVCAGVDERTAGQAPEGRWSPKEILSHLCGPQGSGHLPILRAFIDQDTPTIDLDTENPFFTPARQQASFVKLLSEVEGEYERICKFTTELTDDQLGRRARIPKLKESPLGEYPSLESMISGLGEYHLQFHIDHMREILRELAF